MRQTAAVQAQSVGLDISCGASSFCRPACCCSNRRLPDGVKPRCFSKEVLQCQRQNRLGALMAMRSKCSSVYAAAAALKPEMKALIFDCDGVILESEGLHRIGYNDSFGHFSARHEGKEDIIDWNVKYYDMLQNTLGGGKQKMRWYFDRNGWPLSTLQEGVPSNDEQKAAFIDTLQEWKTARYQELIGSGDVQARPGIKRLVGEAMSVGLKVGVCTAATRSSAVVVLQSLLGRETFEALDVFIAGDDVPRKKPDPIIYKLAAERLGVHPEECLVVEDSRMGLQAAMDAGMRCLITFTDSTSSQEFVGAEKIVQDLDNSVTVQAMKSYQLSGDVRK
ncbi:hypothetical protein WJX74_008854 [Apatococcus lobatus]|uniref:Uncharacterized protein n=1 Tax=Apatococcus lobatus TaxID=904363 RepID=A0AAW1PYK8_9CHLO